MSLSEEGSGWVLPGLGGAQPVGASCGTRETVNCGAVVHATGGGGCVEPGGWLGGWGGLCGDEGACECQGWEPEEMACSGAGTFSPKPQHLPLMKHFITAALGGGGHPIRNDKFPTTALCSLAAAVILLHLE